MLCSYGCYQEAKFYIGSKRKPCCSDKWFKCQAIRNKISNSNKGKQHSIKTKEKMSESRKGQNHPMYGKRHSKETIQKMSSVKKGKPAWNKGKTDIYSEDTLKRMSNSSRTQIDFTKDMRLKWSKAATMTIEDIKSKYPLFSQIEEMRYNPENPTELQVHCKNHKCKNSKEHNGWFTPKREVIFSRIYRIEKDGIDGFYIYCSNKCKQECVLYGKSDKQLVIYHSTLEYQIYREEVLKREKYKCEYCGKKAKHVHHIRPQKIEPFFSLDPDYGISCCTECHYKYGHPTGTECSTGNLANKKC
ncbi:hypothetical protein KAR91_21980 [Candidatus Pacearchaeota archaeon]|nr:hypothetical protein [Candidatus Pacearchaeota archaeon]